MKNLYLTDLKNWIFESGDNAEIYSENMRKTQEPIELVCLALKFLSATLSSSLIDIIGEKRKLTEEEKTEILIECFFFWLHYLDREAFNMLGHEGRKELLVGITNEFLRFWPTSLNRVNRGNAWHAYEEMSSKRLFEYGNFKYLLNPEEPKCLCRNAVTGQFLKNISTACNSRDFTEDGIPISVEGIEMFLFLFAGLTANKESGFLDQGLKAYANRLNNGS